MSRIVGSPEDLQYVHEYENKDEHVQNTTKSVIVTPTRDSRTNKRRHNMLQAEEAKKRHTLKMTR